MRTAKRGLMLVLLGLVVAALIAFTPVRFLFDEGELARSLQASGEWAGLMYLLIFIGATVLGFPGNIMTIAGGAVFGMVWGVCLSQIGATVGAIGAYWVARRVFHDWFQTRFQHSRLLHRLNRAISDNPMGILLATRLSPLAPFSLINFLYGLTPIPLKTYANGTFWGILPLTFVYTWLGVSGKELLSGGQRLPFIVALSLLGLLALLPSLLKRSRSVS